MTKKKYERHKVRTEKAASDVKFMVKKYKVVRKYAGKLANPKNSQDSTLAGILDDRMGNIYDAVKTFEPWCAKHLKPFKISKRDSTYCAEECARILAMIQELGKQDKLIRRMIAADEEFSAVQAALYKENQKNLSFISFLNTSSSELNSFNQHGEKLLRSFASLEKWMTNSVNIYDLSDSIVMIYEEKKKDIIVMMKDQMKLKEALMH